MRNKGHKVHEIYFKDWINNYLEWPSETEINNFIELLRHTQTQIVLISLRCSAYHKVTAYLTGIIRDRLGLPVIWGGLHPTLCPEDSIKDVDIICRGEAERTLPEIIEAIEQGRDYKTVPGFWIKKGGQIYKNDVASLIPELDVLPFRDYEHPDKYRIQEDFIIQGDPQVNDPVYLMMTSRGCVYSCSYCYNSTLKNEIFAGKGSYYRTMRVDTVIEELKRAKKLFKNLKRIKFDDEVFPFKKEWIDEFCEKYKKEINLPFEMFTEPKLVEEEYLAKLKKAGLKIIYMGVQNSEKINEILYDRNTSNDTVLSAVNIMRKLKLDARYQVIVDDPLSTDQDKIGLVEFLMKFPRPFELYLFSLTVYPNTKLAEKLISMGIISENQIEGRATKTFQQLRVDLSYPRGAEDIFMLSIMILLTKGFIPKALIRFLYKRPFFRKHTVFLTLLAKAANIIKMTYTVFFMILKGEFTYTLFTRWMNPKSLVSQ